MRETNFLHKHISVTLHCNLNSPVLNGLLRFTKGRAVDMSNVEVLYTVDTSTQMQSFTNYIEGKDIMEDFHSRVL